MNSKLYILLATLMVVFVSSESDLSVNAKRHFSQQMNGPIFSQQNIQNYQAKEESGPTMSQVNVESRHRFKRHFSQQYNAPIYKQQNIQNYQKQNFNGPISKQTNIESEVKQALEETGNFHDFFDHKFNNA